MSAPAIMAVFRPTSGDIAVFVEDGARHSQTTLQIEEARRLHATLGSALALADSADDPVAAVPQALPVEA